MIEFLRLDDKHAPFTSSCPVLGGPNFADDADVAVLAFDKPVSKPASFSLPSNHSALGEQLF